MPADQIMREFYNGTLRSSNGAKVTKLAQAKAIAASYNKRGEGQSMRKEHEAVADVLGGEHKGKDPKKAKLHEAHVRKAHGGYVVKHHEYRHKTGEVAHDHPMAGSEHVHPNMDAVNAHMQEHMGEESAEAAQEQQGGAGEPPAAGAPQEE